ncbi:helix-turn-helix domain-containing protein [Prevotella communis]|uniref:helix-turn-helix domain-containing protein n=1 Tax=Prevotella communis TaxID=2913614 RepID=UPI000B884883
MKRNCSLEEKLAAIRLVEQGQSARSVSDKLHLGHHILYEWLSAYKESGTGGTGQRLAVA